MPDEPELVRVAIADLNLDRQNANLGTERGDYMLGYSLETYGAGRSIVVDKNMNVIAGNKTLNKWAEMGAEEIILIPNDNGKILVGVMRDDLDLDDEEDSQARGLAYADNRVGDVNLRFDAAQIARDVESGIDLTGLFFEDELDRLVEIGSDPEYIDMEGFAPVGDNILHYRVVIDGLELDEARDIKDQQLDGLNVRVEQYRG